METITLQAEDEEFVFEGELLGTAASDTDGPRWFEVEIYRRASDYVVVTIGRSDVDGEVDRFRWQVFDTPYGVVEYLKRDEYACPRCDILTKPARGSRCPRCDGQVRATGVRFLTNTAKHAIDEAAGRDDEFWRYLAAASAV